MSQQSRRSFLKGMAGLGAAAAVGAQVTPLWASLNAAASPLGIPVGSQLYPIRDLVAKSFPDTLKMLKAAGYEAIEMCSPPYYAERGFAELQKYTGAQLKRMINDEGLVCVSSHISITELRSNLQDRIDWAADLGLIQFNVPSLRGPENPTLSDVQRVADEFNAFAEQSVKSGVTAGIHNEAFELSMVNGVRTYDLLLVMMHPENVKFQFQVSTISRGYDAADYFLRFPGRFHSMHVQDYDFDAKRTVAVGQGDLDWKKIFTAATVGGVKNYFVEMNLEATQASAPYLRSLAV